MKSALANLFKPIGPETVTSKPVRSSPVAGYGQAQPVPFQDRLNEFPIESFALALGLCVGGALLVAGAGFGLSGPPPELVGIDIGNYVVVGFAATLGSFFGGLLAGAFSKELVGPFSAVPMAALLLIGIWMIIGVTDSLLLLMAATFVPLGAGVAVGFLVGTGLRSLGEKTKQGWQ